MSDFAKYLLVPGVITIYGRMGWGKTTLNKFLIWSLKERLRGGMIVSGSAKRQYMKNYHYVDQKYTTTQFPTPEIFKKFLDYTSDCVSVDPEAIFFSQWDDIAGLASQHWKSPEAETMLTNARQGGQQLIIAAHKIQGQISTLIRQLTSDVMVFQQSEPNAINILYENYGRPSANLSSKADFTAAMQGIPKFTFWHYNVEEMIWRKFTLPEVFPPFRLYLTPTDPAYVEEYNSQQKEEKNKLKLVYGNRFEKNGEILEFDNTPIEYQIPKEDPRRLAKLTRPHDDGHSGRPEQEEPDDPEAPMTTADKEDVYPEDPFLGDEDSAELPDPVEEPRGKRTRSSRKTRSSSKSKKTKKPKKSKKVKKSRREEIPEEDDLGIPVDEDEEIQGMEDPDPPMPEDEPLPAGVPVNPEEGLTEKQKLSRHRMLTLFSWYKSEPDSPETRGITAMYPGIFDGPMHNLTYKQLLEMYTKLRTYENLDESIHNAVHWNKFIWKGVESGLRHMVGYTGSMENIAGTFRRFRTAQIKDAIRNCKPSTGEQNLSSYIVELAPHILDAFTHAADSQKNININLNKPADIDIDEATSV